MLVFDGQGSREIACFVPPTHGLLCERALHLVLRVRVVPVVRVADVVAVVVGAADADAGSDCHRLNRY